MPSLRQRQSGVSVSSTATRRVELPEYQPPTYRLTAKAQSDLAALVTPTTLNFLDKHLRFALEILSENVAAINDTARDHEELLRLRKEKQSRDPYPPPADVDKLTARETELAEMRLKVDGLTKRIEESVRKTIDAQQAADDIKTTLADLTRETATQASRPASQRRTQQQQTQASSTQPLPGTFTPTEPSTTQDDDPAAPAPPPRPLIDRFSTSLTRKRERYTSYDHRQRYATNNDYRQFKRLLHDATHDDDAPLGPEHTWFPATAAAAAPQPGHTGPAPDATADSDDDVAVARATISTKCPLTLRDFVDPVTSTKCPHSFERAAIAELVAASSLRVGPAGGERAVQCPVPGCSCVVAMGDLRADGILVRKIARLQRAARRAEEDEGEEGAVRIGSSEVESEGEGRDYGRRVKGERRSGRVGSEEL